MVNVSSGQDECRGSAVIRAVNSGLKEASAIGKISISS